MVVQRQLPAGARSCLRPNGSPGSGGEWVECRELQGEGGLKARLVACCAGLSSNSASLLRNELAALMRDARMGLLTIDTDSGKGQVSVMRTADRVLEIRFTRHYGPVGWQLTRLYFTEPTHEGATLLALHLDWKRDGREGLDDQDEDVRIADARIDDHYRRRR